MRPDTWVPTWTVTSADSVPLAVTRPTMCLRSTGPVLYCSSGARWDSRSRQYPAPAAMGTSTANIHRILVFMETKAAHDKGPFGGLPAKPDRRVDCGDEDHREAPRVASHVCLATLASCASCARAPPGLRS